MNVLECIEGTRVIWNGGAVGLPTDTGVIAKKHGRIRVDHTSDLVYVKWDSDGSILHVAAGSLLKIRDLDQSVTQQQVHTWIDTHVDVPNRQSIKDSFDTYFGFEPLEVLQAKKVLEKAGYTFTKTITQ